MDYKDYSKFTLEELLAEEKKIKKREILTAVLIGFAVGIMTYGIVRKGFGAIYVFIPLGLIFAFSRSSKNSKQKLKEIQAEINNQKMRLQG